MMDRRTFLAGTSALAALGSVTAITEAASQAMPKRPKMSVPANACDAHHHIYDKRFPASPHWTRGFSEAPVADYRALQQRLGLARNVIVQPSTFGVDNRCLLDALTQMGATNARGIVVIDEATTDEELKRMSSLGVRGVRVNFLSAQTWGKTTLDRLVSTAKRIAPLAWHVQVLMSGDQIAASEGTLADLPTPLVIDHLGRVPQPAGAAHDGAKAALRLLAKGRTWMKLSEPYEDSKIGPPGYEDSSALAKTYVSAAPNRIIWGTDWPHPTVAKDKPDDADLLDLLDIWAPDAATRNRILVQNPAELFGFS
jgi:predicted TIM-barrel fold metal-dependent hydrolase